MGLSRGSNEDGSSGKKTRLASFELACLSEQAAKVAVGLGRPVSLNEYLVALIQAALDQQSRPDRHCAGAGDAPE
jgi:hypothetical protein